MKRKDTLESRNKTNILLKCSPPQNINYIIIIIGLIIVLGIGGIIYTKFGKVKTELESCRSSRLSQ